MKLTALPLAALLALSAFVAAQSELPLMDGHQSSLDGWPADISAQPEFVGPSPTELRVFQAQGRRRASYSLVSHVRQFFEEDPSWSTAILAVEMDVDSIEPAEHRLFTITTRQERPLDSGSIVFPAIIQVDDIEHPDTPVEIQKLTLALSDRPEFLRVVPDANVLLVALDPTGGTEASEIRLYSYDNPGLVLDPTPIAVVTLPTTPTACTPTHRFASMRDARIARIQVPGVPGGERMALISAALDDLTCDPSSPQPLGLLVLNIENVHQPFFYTAPNQFWEPCRQPGQPCNDWYVGGFTHVRTDETPPRDLVYLVGGKEIGLQELDLTNLTTTGIAAAPPYGLSLTESFATVVADPEASSGFDYLYVFGRSLTYVVDRKSLTNPPIQFKTSPSDLAWGAAGDTPLVLMDLTGTGPVRREIWTLARQTATDVLRVTDVTQDPTTMGLEDPTSAGYYSAGPTDGAAMSGSNVYAATFGGVVRYDLSSGEAVPVPDSYEPALDAGVQHNTEDLELVDLGSGGVIDEYLLAPCAKGDFFAWRIDPVTRDPLAGSLFQAPAGYWPVQGLYGNDLLVWTNPFVPPALQQKVVLLDYSASAALGTIMIGAYNWTNPGWITTSAGTAIQWTDPLGKIKGNVRALAADGNWLVAGANGGFLVVSVPNRTVTDWVYTESGEVGGLSFARVMGVAIHGDRIFASFGDVANELTGDPDQRFAFASYAFDPSPGMGKVIDKTTLSQSDLPIQVLFDGQQLPTLPPTTVDDFPGVFMSSGEQVTKHVVEEDPTTLRLYTGSHNGHLVEIQWEEATDTLTPLSYWHNGAYCHGIAEATAYKVGMPIGGMGSFGPPTIDFTIRILVAKVGETFELVSPPDMP